ncbi:MAG: aldo/keto reductase [Desulfobacterales bacterium]|nr:aldo/keto reductase [Desulfobacterales bacterium]
MQKALRLGTSDIMISPVVMGMWQAGKEMWAGIDDAEIKKSVRAAVDAGISAFDTAEMYGKGHSERILAAATAGIRDRVVLMTKVFSNHLQYDQVIAACHRSLKNLNTDVIDLYQIHWPAGSFGSRQVPIEETMRAMTDLKAQGKIRAVGVSNFSRAQLEEAARYGRIDSLQPPYSLLWRQAERDALPYCAANDITVLAYSPMAQGILAGRFGAAPTFEKGDHRRGHRLFQPDIYPQVLKAVEGLGPIARRRGVSLAQLALAWVLSHPDTCAIAGARSPAQAAENAGAMQVELSTSELAAMEALSRPVTGLLDDNPVQWDF